MNKMFGDKALVHSKEEKDKTTASSRVSELPKSQEYYLTVQSPTLCLQSALDTRKC